MIYLYTATVLTALAAIVSSRSQAEKIFSPAPVVGLLCGGIGVYLGGILGRWGTLIVPADIFGISGVSLTLAGLYANRFQGGAKSWATAAGIATIFFIVAAVTGGDLVSSDQPNETILRLHIGFIIASAGFLVCLGSLAGMYVIKERALRLDPVGLAKRLPSLDDLDKYQLRSLQAGFVLLTISMAFGFQLLLSTKEEDIDVPVDILAAITLATWGILAATLYLRLWRGWRGHRLAVFSSAVVCLLIVVATLSFGFQLGIHEGG